MASLFDPIQFGAVRAPNRILMAPMTRARATKEAVPTQVMADYYRKRAGAGLIISEATGISREGLGWPYAPGLWNEAQVEAWKPVTGAVREAGGRIFAQLWHMGRVVHPDLGGGQPVSASATTAPHYAHTYEGKKPYVESRALTIDDIQRIIDDYTRAAANALTAGFDGVQIHAANGYLIDQFLRESSNLRDDDYGGAPENRIRFLVEVAEAVAATVGAERTAVRFSPNGESQGVEDSNPASVFVPAAQAMERIGLAFIEMREQGPEGTFGKSDQAKIFPQVREAVKTPIVLNQDFTAALAQAALDDGADAIAFGRPFIANPDLPERIRIGAALNADEMATWYSQGLEGYVDYPTLEEEREAA
ncbi:MAG: N-ethylmaleimide reductase [Alphaproteobacteria bacterium]|jgi:N-ethylmaleimide reductase|nr:N-ethylmaleimide reductase [Alphaproteobacteria bacterium]